MTDDEGEIDPAPSVSEPFWSWADEYSRLFEDARTSELEKSDVEVEPSVRKDAQSFDDIEKDRLKQASKLRVPYFWIAAGLAGIAVVVSCVLIIGVVFFAAEVSDALGIAFISGLTIETLGVLNIVGKYLFTQSDSTQPGDARPKTEDQ